MKNEEEIRPESTFAIRDWACDNMVKERRWWMIKHMD